MTPNWKYDESYGESKPKRVYRIYCFSCSKDVVSKHAARAKHRGHDVAYLDRDGKRED